jgi:hypothetical protein
MEMIPAICRMKENTKSSNRIMDISGLAKYATATCRIFSRNKALTSCSSPSSWPEIVGHAACTVVEEEMNIKKVMRTTQMQNAMVGDGEI